MAAVLGELAPCLAMLAVGAALVSLPVVAVHLRLVASVTASPSALGAASAAAGCGSSGSASLGRRCSTRFRVLGSAVCCVLDGRRHANAVDSASPDPRLARRMVLVLGANVGSLASAAFRRLVRRSRLGVAVG